jgi:cytochrome P450
MRTQKEMGKTEMTETASYAKTEEEFDYHSHAHAANAQCVYRDIRESTGIIHTDSNEGYYVLTRYADIAAAARNHETFTSKKDFNGPGLGGGGISIPPNPATSLSLDELDPPEWKRVRSALNPTLAPGAVQRLMPSIEEITTYFIDQFIEVGEADLVLALFNPIPAIMTLDYLGIPRQGWERYADPIHKMAYVRRGLPEYDVVFQGTVWILEQLQELITERRREPRDDFVSNMMRHEAGGTPFSDEEIKEMMFIALGGGIDTTTALMSNTMFYLYEHPEERRRLQDDPSLLDSACEEFLRYFTPVQALARTVGKPVVVEGVELKHGDRVLLAWASANRDPEQFDDPDEVKLDRFPNRHCSFGIGIHRCIGSNLARSIFKTVIPELLRRIPDYEVDTANARRYDRIGIVNGWEQIPITFTPGKREGSLQSL